MKKTRLALIALLVLSLLVAVFTTGCSNQSEPEATEAPAATEAATEAPTEEPTETPTEEPAAEATDAPAEEAAAEPTDAPAEEAAAEPTDAPAEEPAAEPTDAPAEEAAPAVAAGEEPVEAAETAAEPAGQPYAGTTLTVYNWYDYIDEAVIDLFEEETGINVEYVNFTTNEEMYAKLEATPGAYDVLFPSDYIIERLIKEDMLAELNYDNMPNAAGLMDWLKDPDYDEGGKYSVAYMWGTVGYLYNTTMVDRELTSWDDMFSEEFKGNVLMMDSVRDTLGVALKSLGYSMNSSDEAELEAARDKLIEQKQNGVCAGYLVDEIKDKMVGGEAAIGLVWSGDALYAMEKNEDLAYCVPEEGSNIWVDAMCIPAASQNKEAAECFIDFMCRPDIARMNMDYIYYSTPIQAVVDGMSEEEAANEVLNPPQDVVDRCEFFRDMSDYMDLYESIWMEVRMAR